MPELELSLVLASFGAGVLMFLAPCTLPLVPAFLAFISGLRPASDQPLTRVQHSLIIRNSLLYCAGFSVVFISFGLLFGFLGAFLIAFRSLLAQIGGGLIVVFGLMMLGVVPVRFLHRSYTIRPPAAITPGRPSAAFLLGIIFAVGWTPCVGPVLASVLLLASTPGSVFSGGVLLAFFSLGMALPFVLVAIFYARAQALIHRSTLVSASITTIGGVFLVLIGGLLLTGNFIWTVEYGYQLFHWLGIGGLFELL